MKRFTKKAGVVLALSALLAVAASTTANAATTNLIGSGSVAMQPYIVKLISAYKKVAPNVAISYTADGGNAGVKDVQKGTSQFAGQARAQLPTDTGTTFAKGFKDGLAIVLSPKNKVKNLSLQQVSDIFTGKVTDWSQVPGSGRTGTIVPFGRESSSGQYTFFLSAVLNNQPQGSNVTTVLSDGAVRSGVASDPNGNGIGYIGQAYLNKSVKAVSLNHVAISYKTVKNSKYPLNRYLYWVTPANPNPDVVNFVNWARTSILAGQVIEKEGGVAVFNKRAKVKKKKAKKSSIAAFESALLG